MASELIWPYVKNEENPTIDNYLEWSRTQTNETYKLKFEQVKSIMFFNELI